MKNELILSSLILTAQISPQAMADVAIQKELNQGVEQAVIKTPLFKINHPFNESESIEMYALVTITKDKYEINDLNFSRVTHNISFQFFNKADEEIKDFRVNESEEGGYFLELRGARKGQKSYTLWSCSSTMNCGHEAPGFLHVYENEDSTRPYYYVIELPVFHDSKEGMRHERIFINFESNKKLIK